MFELGDKIHFIYRAMGDDMVSRLGYASSYDGYVIHERLNYPILSPTNSLEKRGCERLFREKMELESKTLPLLIHY
jgi:hypothetical protein